MTFGFGHHSALEFCFYNAKWILILIPSGIEPRQRPLPPFFPEKVFWQFLLILLTFYNSWIVFLLRHLTIKISQ